MFEEGTTTSGPARAVIQRAHGVGVRIGPGLTPFHEFSGRRAQLAVV
jgi:hypothetical protein